MIRQTSTCQKILAFLVSLACAVGCLSACAPADGPAETAPASSVASELSESPLTRTWIDYFDTVTTVTVFAENEEQGQAFLTQIEQELSRLHRLYSAYESYEGINNIKTINDAAGGAPVPVDPDIIDLMKQCLEANRRSAGAVNMALGPVLALWHEARTAGLEHPETAALPDTAVLRTQNAYTDISRVEVDEVAGTVRLPLPEMRLDVGSGAKGLACEKIAQSLQAAGLRSGMLSLGGNIRTIGAKGPQAQPWLVGIRDPRDFDPVDKAPGGEQQPPARELAFVLAVQDKAVVTSGVYQRGYVADGGYYHHIIDPETLFPSTRYDSVTIVCGDSGLADSLTTALFNLSREEGAALLADIPDAEAVWIQGENHWFTDGFSQYIKK